jgi:hypothetical protein
MPNTFNWWSWNVRELMNNWRNVLSTVTCFWFSPKWCWPARFTNIACFFHFILISYAYVSSKSVWSSGVVDEFIGRRYRCKSDAFWAHRFRLLCDCMTRIKRRMSTSFCPPVMLQHVPTLWPDHGPYFSRTLIYLACLLASVFAVFDMHRISSNSPQNWSS